MENIVIIGGVAAGATAAAKVRRISPKAQITLLEAGPDISFANCGLPYYISGEIKSRSKLILQSPESFKQQYDVDVYTHSMVTSIDRAACKVITMDTRSEEYKTFEYTRLILAQGGRPVTPNLPGADLDHVFTLWTLEDMDKISIHLAEKKPKNAVVVGGGFIGLEMVEALVKRGLKVNVVEMMPHVMSAMDPETAGFLQEEMLFYGVDIYTGMSVTDIAPKFIRLSNGTILDADMVLLSIGVRPTLQLAVEAGLKTGDAGGLLVNKYLQTSDPNIYAAGDMVEIEHRVIGKKVRIPLAGPANRQGRIAAENAMGGKRAYKGALGTSVVRVFDAVAGITGLSLKQARAAHIDADAVAVHKEHHTSYYPGSKTVSVQLVYDRQSGVILGGQTAGYKGADKRLDVIATAAAAKLTIYDLADTDFAYSPPIGTANDALNMAAYTAENKMTGFSPSVMVSELDDFVEAKNPIIVDIRDLFAYEKNHIQGAIHLPAELLGQRLHLLPANRPILVYDETGKKGHQALRTLLGAGFGEVTNLSGGYISLQRHARAIGFHTIKIDLLPLTKKSVESVEKETVQKEDKVAAKNGDTTSILIVDVRTAEEFRRGAYPGAVNIPLDEITFSMEKIGSNLSREIVVYCASGARSAYAKKVLDQLGYRNVKNGGGIAAMIAAYPPKAPVAEDSKKPLIIDVRTPDEFSGGAYRGAINIPLDLLPSKVNELGSHSREIILYCASGARSAYGQRVLKQLGFTNVKNGGGIMQMMQRSEYGN